MNHAKLQGSSIWHQGFVEGALYHEVVDLSSTETVVIFLTLSAGVFLEKFGIISQLSQTKGIFYIDEKSKDRLLSQLAICRWIPADRVLLDIGEEGKICYSENILQKSRGVTLRNDRAVFNHYSLSISTVCEFIKGMQLPRKIQFDGLHFESWTIFWIMRSIVSLVSLFISNYLKTKARHSFCIHTVVYLVLDHGRNIRTSCNQIIWWN